MENPEEVLQTLDEFTKLKPKDIPKELEDYLSYVAKTGDPVYQWSLVKSLFREKLLNVITDFYEGCPSVELPPCPNVDTFNYDTMKDRLIERLELFASAPFTIQRLCELLTSPKKQYSRADKFMRAVEKNIMVVSTREPGQIRRNDSSQPELVNGVADTSGLEHEPSRINLDGLGLADSATTAAFLSTSAETSEEQLMFDDSVGLLEKTHSPNKSYDEGYVGGVPRRASSWFRDRVESSENTPNHSSHVSTRTNEESDVDVGNQLAEKCHGPVGLVERGIVEEDEDDIEDDYVEPTQIVAHFNSQEPNSTLLGIENADEYCCPPSPEEESSETSVAVSTIAEGTSNPLSDASILEEDSLPNLVISPGGDIKDSFSSSVSESEASDTKIEKNETESPSLKTTIVDEKEQTLVAVELICENTIPVALSTTCAETLVDSNSDMLSNQPTVTKTDSLEADIKDVNAASSDAEVVSSDPTDLELSKGKTETIDEIAVSKSKSPEPTVVEPVESEITITDSKAEECTESTIKIVECVSVKEFGPIEAEAIELSVIDSLKAIAPEESSDVTAEEIPVVEEVNSPISLTPSATSSDPTPEGTTEKAAVQDDVETVPELPVEVSAEGKTETAPEVPEETSESVASVGEERDREMMIQNERVESVIQENVEQSPVQEETLMQQVFVPSEIPMDEKTSESEPEAMEVDETSQTVEEPMEQGDISPNIS